MGRNINNKNLSEFDMAHIEFHLNSGAKPSEIGEALNRDPSGIRKEIKYFSTFHGVNRNCRNCLNKSSCKVKFLCKTIPDRDRCSSCRGCSFAAELCVNFSCTLNCSLLKKHSNVCNSCDNIKKCKITLRYIAKNAFLKHSASKSSSHKPLKIDDFPDDFKDYLSKLIINGISPQIILNTLPDKYKQYNFAVKTFYLYIDKHVLNCINLDLRNQTSRSKNGTNTTIRNSVRTHQLNGRSIEDVDSDILSNLPLGYFELDSVEGIKGGAVLLTIMIPKFSLMLAFKMDHKNNLSVKQKLDDLENVLGDDFYILFKVGITDNGSEFIFFEALEKSISPNRKKRLSIHYAHSYSSFEKPHVENNHILLRWLVKKGYDISLYSDDDIIDIINKLNNYPRPKKDYKTPIQLLEEEFGSDILDKLDLHHIPIDELIMKWHFPSNGI